MGTIYFRCDYTNFQHILVISKHYIWLRAYAMIHCKITGFTLLVETSVFVQHIFLLHKMSTRWLKITTMPKKWVGSTFDPSYRALFLCLFRTNCSFHEMLIYERNKTISDDTLLLYVSITDCRRAWRRAVIETCSNKVSFEIVLFLSFTSDLKIHLTMLIYLMLYN